MPRSQWSDEDLMPPFEGFKALDDVFQNQETSGKRDDLSVCFVCLRWTSGDPNCRLGNECDVRKSCAADEF
jgi:hypothetical protein